MAQKHLAGKQILIVEDSYVTACHIATVLAAHGTVVLGPVNSAADAHRVLQRSRTDGVVLDAKLGAEACAALVALLRQRGVPMLMIGHSRHDPASPDLAGRRRLALAAEMNSRAPSTAFPAPRAGQRMLPRVSDADLIWKSRRAVEDSYGLLAGVREREAKQARAMRQWRLQRQGRSFADFAAPLSGHNSQTERALSPVTISEPDAARKRQMEAVPAAGDGRQATSH